MADQRVFTATVKCCLEAGPRISDALSATRSCLASIRDSRTLQGLIDKPVLQKALVARAADDGKDVVQPLVEEIKSATRGWFQCDLGSPSGGAGDAGPTSETDRLQRYSQDPEADAGKLRCRSPSPD